MSTINTIKSELTAIIGKANAKTGGADATVSAAVDRLIDGYGTGGGSGGDAPSGSIDITANGTHNVAGFATAQVNVQGLNARLFDITLDSDKTANVELLKNDWLKSLRNDPNAFVMMRCLEPKASTAMISFWFTANFVLYHSGTTAYNSMVTRSTASAGNTNSNSNGLPGDNYNGHLNIDANGGLWAIANATYPIKAGAYQIIAGTVEKI
jgi:hypothetical protein